MYRPIAKDKTFANSVISRELDNRARRLAEQLGLTRSKLMAKALADFVNRLETDPAQLEVQLERRLA